MNVAERFVRARALAMGITTLRELAHQAEVSPKALRTWLEGSRTPTRDRVARLAAILDVNAESLRSLLTNADGEASP